MTRTIKKCLVLPSIILLAIHVFAAPPSVPFNLAWQDTNSIQILTQYAPKTNDCYILTGTNNAAAPQPWPVLAVFTTWTLSTNAQGIWFNAQYQAVPDHMFFTIVTSNFWGMANPSNVEQTGPASTPSVNLLLSR